MADEKQKTIHDISKTVFDESELAGAQEFIAEVEQLAKVAEVPTVWNFDPDETEFPDGYGFAVAPIKRRSGTGEKMETYGVVFGAVPLFDVVMDNESGARWVREQISATMVDKLIAEARPETGEEMETDAEKVDLPFSIPEFIAPKRGESVKAFSAVAPALLSVLKKKAKIKTLTQGLLRLCLSSTDAAKNQYPKVSQDTWIKVINAGKQLAISQKEDPAIFDRWLTTRDKVAATEVDDEKVQAALEGLFADMADNSDDADDAETVDAAETETVETADEPDEPAEPQTAG